MRRFLALVLATAAMLAASIAAADATPRTRPAGVLAVVSPAHAESDVALAVGVNPPLSWIDGNAVAGSVHVGWARHHAVRLNIASYAFTATSDLASAIYVDDDGELEDESYSGRTLDLGIGYQYFTRRHYDGLSLEAGLLRRAVDHTTTYTDVVDGMSRQETTTASTYAVRGLVGWSWLFEEHIYVAVAAGVSIGDLRGRETSVRADGMTRSDVVARTDVALESYLRIGFAFGR